MPVIPADRSVGDVASAMEEFRASHEPWHRLQQSAHALRDGGVILGLRCLDCPSRVVGVSTAKGQP